MNKLLIVGLILVVAGFVAVPAFAQLLPQGETAVTDPVGGGGSVPEDVTGTEPSGGSTEEVGLPADSATNPAAPAGGSAADVIPVELSSELCADVTDPLVVGTFEKCFLRLYRVVRRECLHLPVRHLQTIRCPQNQHR